MTLRIWWLVCLLLFLAACGGDTPPPTSEPGPTAEATPAPSPTPARGELTLWHSWTQRDNDALTEMLANFQRLHPALTVNVRFIPYDELPQFYTNAVQSGTGPDLLLGANWWLPEFVGSEVVQPLDKMLSAEAIAEYWPAAINNLRWAGQLYGLPTHVEVIALFYNQALIEPKDLPQTTAELLATARQTPQQGIGLYTTIYHLFWGFPAYGGTLFDKEGRVILDRSNGAAEFLRWVMQIQQTPGSFVDLDYGMLLERFKKGEFAFFVDGPWSIDDLHNTFGDDLGVLPLPAGPVGASAPWLHADGIFLNPTASATQQELSLLLVRYLSGPESGALLTQTARRVPAHQAADVDFNPLIQGFVDQAATAQAMPMRPEMTQVWDYGDMLITKALAGVMPAEDVVIEVSALINEENDKN